MAPNDGLTLKMSVADASAIVEILAGLAGIIPSLEEAYLQKLTDLPAKSITGDDVALAANVRRLAQLVSKQLLTSAAVLPPSAG